MQIRYYDHKFQHINEAVHLEGEPPQSVKNFQYTPVSGIIKKTVVYLLQAWSKSGDYWATTCQTKENIQKVFNEKGIRISYNNMNVTVKKGE